MVPPTTVKAGVGQKQRMHFENPTLLIANVQHHDLTGQVGIQDSCLKGYIANANGCIASRLLRPF
jgi:hypothetical protein